MVQPFNWNGAYGYEWDCFAGTGLYHVGAREYDPRTARWLQRDPIDAASGDPNLYRYAGNDPLNHHDPDGKQEHCSATCARGRAEIVKMALEEARQTGSIRLTSWWTFGSRFLQHHIFPQVFRKMFKRIGIDIDDCIIVVADWFHSWIHSGKGKGGWWNQQWKKFENWADDWLKQRGLTWKDLENPQNACARNAKDFLRQQALNWAQQMLRAVGITDFDWSECLRYNSKAAKKLIESLKN